MNLPQERFLSAAQSLAARGQHRLALALLDMLKTSTSSLQAVAMLKGKILAQMGRYGEAIGAWETILSQVPNHQEAAACVSRAKQMQASPTGAYGPRIRMAAFVAGALSLLALLLVSFAAGRHTASQEIARRQTMLGQVRSDLRDAIDAAVAKSVSGMQREDSGKWAEEIAGLQANIKALLPPSVAGASTGQIQVATERIVALLGETQDRLNSLRLDMAKEQTATEVARATRDLQVSTSNEWVRWSRQLGEVALSLKVLQSQQDQIAERQLAENQTVASLSQAVESLRGDLSAMREQVVQERARSDQALRLTIAALRPVNMDRLDRQIKEAEGALATTRDRETALRNKGNLADSIRHGRTVKVIRDIEAELLALREQWDTQVGPWLRTSTALTASSVTTNGTSDVHLSDAESDQEVEGDQKQPPGVSEDENSASGAPRQ
jgi:tetratricopeptide (TPR) repeat protein